MGRYLFPGICLLLAGGIGWYNATHSADQIALIWLSPLVGDDPILLGQVTVGLLGTVGVLGVAWGVVQGRRGAAEDAD